MSFRRPLLALALVLGALGLRPGAARAQEIPGQGAINHQGWFLATNDPDAFQAGTDLESPYDGRACGILRAVRPPHGYGTFMQIFRADAYRGKRVRFRGMVRTAEVTSAALWMRVDGLGRTVLAFDNMADRPIVGTMPWRQYAIVLDVPREAEAVAFGLILNGGGVAWMDNLVVEVVDSSIPTTGKRQVAQEKPLNLDFERTPDPQQLGDPPRLTFGAPGTQKTIKAPVVKSE